MAVYGLHMPTGGGEAGLLVHGGRQIGRPVDGYAVVIPDHDQAAKAQMTGQINGFVADALHQATVSGQNIGPVIDQIVAEAGVIHPLGQCHPDGGGNALTQRAGGSLDPFGMTVFGMTGGAIAHLAEIPQLLGVHVVIAQQMVDGVDQHRAVACAHHKAVAVGPAVIGGVNGDKTVEQNRRDIGQTHRRAGVAGIGGLHRIHCQHADRVGHTGFINHNRGLNVHLASPQARLDSLTRRRIIGVKISCIARSIFPPGITSELARVIQLSWIIDIR